MAWNVGCEFRSRRLTKAFVTAMLVITSAASVLATWSQVTPSGRAIEALIGQVLEGADGLPVGTVQSVVDLTSSDGLHLIVREGDRLNASPWQVRAAPAYRERGNADRELLGTETVLIPVLEEF
jgi:hypothetical protein